MATTVLIADDHPIVLHGLERVIAADPEFRVVATAEDGSAALLLLREHRPELAVLDINMPGLSGLEVQAAIRQDGIATRVILLTASATDADLYDAMAAGTAGILFKDSAAEMITSCMRKIRDGGHWLPDELVGPGLEREMERRRKWQKLSPLLTPREREIIQHVIAGLPYKEMAYRIGVSEGTAKVHLNNIFRKLDVASRKELVELAQGQIA